MSRRTSEGNAYSSVAVKILHLNSLLTAAGAGLAASAGQTSSRWRVLAAAEVKTMTVAEIARALGLTRQSVQRMADLLTEEGFTIYKENATDKRTMYLSLTGKGRKALTTIQAEQARWANEMGDKLGATSLKQIENSLRILIDVLEET